MTVTVVISRAQQPWIHTVSFVASFTRAGHCASFVYFGDELWSCIA